MRLPQMRPLVAIWRTDVRRCDLVEWHVAGNAVVRIDIPHAIFHAQDLALIVGGAILEPPRVVTIKPALVVGRETSLPSAVSATPLVPTIDLGTIRGDLIEWHIAGDDVVC